METHASRTLLLSVVQMPSIPLRDRAFIAFLFLTGARVGEVVYKIQKKQVSFAKVDGKDFLIVYDVHTEKRKIDIARNIPIEIEREQVFVDVVLRWTDQLQPEDVMFDFNRTRGFQITKKHLGRGPHFLRHSRLTNLATEYGFDSGDLAEFVGWASWRTAETYTHKDYTDLARKMAARAK